MNAKLGVLLSMQQFQVMNKKRMPTAGLEPTQILVKHICKNWSKNYKCALLSGEDRNTNVPEIQFPIEEI